MTEKKKENKKGTKKRKIPKRFKFPPGTPKKFKFPPIEGDCFTCDMDIDLLPYKPRKTKQFTPIQSIEFDIVVDGEQEASEQMDVDQYIQDKIVEKINATNPDPNKSQPELYLSGYRAGKSTIVKAILNEITNPNTEFVAKTDRAFYILQMAEIDHLTIPNGTHMGVVMEYESEDYVVILEHREQVLNYMNNRGVLKDLRKK
jgi:hypothetical protein